MDEEETKRASDAVFQQTASAGYENPSTAIQMNRQRGLGNAPTPEGEQMAAAQDNVGEARLINNVIRGGSSFDPRIEAAYQSDPGSFAAVWQNAHSVPGASEAFAQLDSVPSVQPREFDEASAADLPEPAQAALRDSWDRSLETVRGEIDKIASGNGGIAQSDELGQYMEKLYQKIDESRARPAQRQQQLNPRDFQVLKQPTFEVLVDDRDWQAAANRRLDSQYGEDPFAF